ncbi:MAG: hypothetical protein HY000_23230, partial [Planctomycetes bacterium]|nr:hypothetical protein [Planctomycetota bacterium]
MFNVFRRHQKKWMAALTIMAMIAFCFPFARFFSGDDRRRGKKQDEVIERAFGRDVVQSDINRARFERNVGNTFLLESRAAIGDPWAARFPDIVLSRYGFGSTRDEEDIKSSIRQAFKADELGITVSDDMVRAWITRVTMGLLTTEKFQAVVGRVGKLSDGISAQTLFDILRRQLRIQRVRDLAVGRFGYGSIQVTPYDVWQHFRRLNDKFTLEIVPVAASEFASKIADPGDDELRELYDKYIARLPDPASPEPGFKEPRKVHLRYAFASLDEFLAATNPEVSDEEIKQHYERNKEFYRKPPPKQDESKAPTDSKPTEGTAPTEEQKKEPAKSGDENKENPPASKEGEVEKKEDSKSPNKQPTPDKSDNEETKKNPPKSVTPPAQWEDQDVDDPQNPTDRPSESSPKPASGAKPSDQAPAAKQEGESASSEPKKDTPKDSPEPADGSKAQTKDEPKEQPKTEPSSEEMKTEDSSTPKKDEPPQYKTLEKVTEEIRERLARSKARAELIKRLDQVQDLISDFSVNTYLRAKSEFEEAKNKQPDLEFQPPSPPDIDQQLDKWHLRSGDTGLLSLDEIAKIPGLGKSTELVGESSSGRPIVAVITGGTDDLYDPRSFRDSEEGYFVVWKVADQAAREPLFGEIREQVLAAYRMIKAREQAQGRAEKMAQRLRDSG